MTAIGEQCATCGERHSNLPFAWHIEQPDSVADIPREERRTRVILSSDQCEVDDEFCIRGLVRLPVVEPRGISGGASGSP